MSRAAALLAVATIAVTPGAFASKITVKAGGTYPTIQAGVDAAAAGDTVVVKAGTYQENVSVPAGKDGLTLTAKGDVVLDARGPAGVGQGPGIRIDSADVSVKGFVIQNAKVDPDPPNYDGHGIEGLQTGLTVESCTFIGNVDSHVTVTGSNATIKSSSFLGGGTGVSTVGADATLTNLEMRCLFAGISTFGDRATVTKCEVRNVTTIAIDVDGNDCSVSKCTTEASEDTGILVDGDRGSIKKCDVYGADDAGINYKGDDGVIDQNEVECVEGPGLEIEGDNPTVTDNEISNVTGDEAGIYVTDNPIAGLIDGNEVTGCTDVGIEIDTTCAGLTVSGNEVSECGNSFESGFLLRGSGHTVTGNSAKRNNGDGFLVNGASITLEENQAKENAQDGIDVHSSSSGVILQNNSAKENAAEGIENNGSGTTVEDNTSKGNRIDFANDGTVSSFTGNTSGDGTDDSTAPEID